MFCKLRTLLTFRQQPLLNAIWKLIFLILPLLKFHALYSYSSGSFYFRCLVFNIRFNRHVQCEAPLADLYCKRCHISFVVVLYYIYDYNVERRAEQYSKLFVSRRSKRIDVLSVCHNCDSSSIRARFELDSIREPCHNCDSIGFELDSTRFELDSSIRERMNMFNFFHSRMVL